MRFYGKQKRDRHLHRVNESLLIEKQKLKMQHINRKHSWKIKKLFWYTSAREWKLEITFERVGKYAYREAQSIAVSVFCAESELNLFQITHKNS